MVCLLADIVQNMKNSKNTLCFLRFFQILPLRVAKNLLFLAFFTNFNALKSIFLDKPQKTRGKPKKQKTHRENQKTKKTKILGRILGLAIFFAFLVFSRFYCFFGFPRVFWFFIRKPKKPKAFLVFQVSLENQKNSRLFWFLP